MRRFGAVLFASMFVMAAAAWGATATLHGASPRTARHHTAQRRRTRAADHSRRPSQKAEKANPKVATLTASPAEAVGAGQPLFGLTAIGGNRDSNPAGTAEAFPIASATNGTASSIDVYVSSGATARRLYVGLYATSGGLPGRRLSWGSLASPRANKWNRVSIGDAQVDAGARYWIALLGTGGQLSFRDRISASCRSYTSRAASLSMLPATWASGHPWPTCDVSAYTSGYAATVVGPPASSAPAPVSSAPAPVSSAPAPVSSAPTPVEAPPTPPPAPPVIQTLPSLTGQAVEGQALSASTGAWKGNPSSYVYAWADCDTTGANCSRIGGATAPSYMLTSADLNHTVRVTVTAVNAGGAGTATSVQSLVVAAPPAQPAPPAPADGCTVTTTSLAAVASDAATEPAGATICIADGSYGSLTLSSTRTAYVTVRAADVGKVTLSGLDVTSGASFLHLDGLVVTSNSEFGTTANDGSAPHDIQVTNTVSQGFQVEAGAENYTFDQDASHGGPYGFLLNGSRYPVQGGCCQTANYPLIQNVTIENSVVGPLASTGADAFQVKGFDGLTIKHNDITGIYQNGNHNDGVQTVHGGSNLTITQNWFHHGNIELFMIKDGDITGNNVISENLVDDESPSENPACGGCSTSVFGQYYSPQNATIANNTIISPALVLRSQLGLVGNGNPDYLPPQNVTLTHNVISQFRAEDDDQSASEGVFKTAMTESYNVFGSWTTNWLTPDSTDQITNSPTFKCSPNCGPSGSEDYQLASNPNDIGIDWNPADQSYGPQ